MTGFTQDAGYRVFRYEGVGEDRVRIGFTVRADLALSRKYGIRLQELPLMCLGILERNSDSRAITFTEEAMILYSEDCAAVRDAAAVKRASQRRQPVKPPAPPAEFNPFSDSTPAPAKPYGQSW
jgi:hypothetical protein